MSLGNALDLWESVLSSLLPGDSDWPGAKDLEMVAALSAAADRNPDLHDALNAIGALLPEDFSTAGVAERTSSLKEIETQLPAAFGALVESAYSLYYLHPRVSAQLESLTGYPARPPQPDGYQLSPFDERVIAVTAARLPFYRQTSEPVLSDSSDHDL